MELESLLSLINSRRGSVPLAYPQVSDALWLVRDGKTLKILSRPGGMLDQLAIVLNNMDSTDLSREDIMVAPNEINPVLSEQIKIIRQDNSRVGKNA